MAFASNLSNAVRGSNRMLLVLVGVVVLSLVYIFFIYDNSEPVPASQLRTAPSTLRTVQGEREVSPEMARNLTIADGQRIEQAAATGTSAMPTVTAQATTPVGLGLDDRGGLPDLVQPARPDLPVIRAPVIAASPLPAPMPPAAMPMAAAQVQDDGTVENMRRQLDSISRVVYPPANVTYHYDAPPDIGGPAAFAPGPAAIVEMASPIALPLPGTVVYAQMISEASSDAPGPVLAEILQGPLAGARLIGSFQSQRDKMVISFGTLALGTDRDGKVIDASVPVSAYAVDSRTVGTAMASSVDYHLLENVGVTFAAAFVEGFGRAIGQSGQTISQGVAGQVITNPALSTREQLYVAGGTAAGAAGQSLTQLFGNRPPTVKVAAGTAIGVLFLGNGRQ